MVRKGSKGWISCLMILNEILHWLERLVLRIDYRMMYKTLSRRFIKQELKYGCWLEISLKLLETLDFHASFWQKIWSFMKFRLNNRQRSFSHLSKLSWMTSLWKNIRREHWLLKQQLWLKSHQTKSWNIALFLSQRHVKLLLPVVFPLNKKQIFVEWLRKMILQKQL